MIFWLFIAISFSDLCYRNNLNLKPTENENISINSLPAYASRVFLRILMPSNVFSLITRRRILGSNKLYFLRSFEVKKKTQAGAVKENQRQTTKNEVNKCNEMLSLQNKSSFIISTNDNESAFSFHHILFFSLNSVLFIHLKFF